MSAYLRAWISRVDIFFLAFNVEIRISPYDLHTISMKTKKQTQENLESGPRIARKLDLDPATIRRWASEGCPHHILGEGLIRYKFDEVLAWRAERKAKSKLQPQPVIQAKEAL